MIRTGWLAAFALALSPLASSGQYGGMGMGGMGGVGNMASGGIPKDAEEWTVKIETQASQAVTGRIKLVNVAVQCDLGLYEIRPEKIREVQFTPIAKDAPYIVGPGGGQRDGVVMTASGEKIAGTVVIPPWWRVRTDLGMLTPDAQRIKSLTFVAKVEPEPAQPQPQGQKPGGSQRGNQPSGKAQQPAQDKPDSATADVPK